MTRKEEHNLDDYISPEEREHLLAGLHRFLVWVGEKVPDEVEVNGKSIKLHELIWRCIHKKKAFRAGENATFGIGSYTGNKREA